MNSKPGLLTSLRASGDWIIPTAAVALVFVMLVPMPSIVLDLLLTVSITASVLVLLTAIQILRPVQFSVFPSLILLLTLMRLSLDVASTRRILLHGNEGTSAAGKVIEAFGQFVVGGNYIVGFVIFHRADRDSVSGGQPRRRSYRRGLGPLHARRHAGQADGDRLRPEYRAHHRRPGPRAPRCGGSAKRSSAAPWTAQPASARRDSLATILIMVINIVAGLLIGVFQQGMPLRRRVKTYTILTVGDGLVAIIPALLVSVAGGIVVTRASSDQSLGVDIRQADVQDLASAVDCERSVAGSGADSRNAEVRLLRPGRSHHAGGLEDEARYRR